SCVQAVPAQAQSPCRRIALRATGRDRKLEHAAHALLGPTRGLIAWLAMTPLCRDLLERSDAVLRRDFVDWHAPEIRSDQLETQTRLGGGRRRPRAALTSQPLLSHRFEGVRQY